MHFVVVVVVVPTRTSQLLKNKYESQQMYLVF